MTATRHLAVEPAQPRKYDYHLTVQNCSGCVVCHSAAYLDSMVRDALSRGFKLSDIMITLIEPEL